MRTKYFLLVVFISLYGSFQAYSTQKINFKDFMVSLDKLPYKHSAYDLRKAYCDLLTQCEPQDFLKLIKSFEEKIYDPLEPGCPSDQTDFIEELKNLHQKLLEVNDLISPHFEESLQSLRIRLDLARLDQQIFEKKGIKESLQHSAFSLDIQKALNDLVGRILLITSENNGKEEVIYSGSGMRVSLDDKNQPIELKKGVPLNGILTCAHIFSDLTKHECITRAYFLPNSLLDSKSGWPLNTDPPLKDTDDLIKYLNNTHMQEFELGTYTIKKRKGDDYQLFPGQALTLASPRYYENEDILFVRFKKESKLSYEEDVSVQFFPIIKEGESKISNGQAYFAIGYPFCDNYEIEEDEFLEENGLYPLFITSAQAHHQEEERAFPSFKEGEIEHEASTSKGMSGGPLIEVLDEKRIRVFGCITRGYSEEKEDYKAKEYGCY